MTQHVLIATTDLTALQERIEHQSRQIERLASAVEAVQMQPAREWVSFKEYAAMHGVSVRTVERHAEQGKIVVRGEGKLREVKV